MDVAQINLCKHALWLCVMMVCCTGATAGAAGETGISSGLHRRLDGAGFLSPQEDDFFKEYKDLVTPPKDLLEAPKDLLETPKDLLEAPEDLAETPKDLLENEDDFEDYAKHGSSGAAAADVEAADVDETHPDEDDDTAAHDKNADRSLAKHLQEGDVRSPSSYGRERDAPAKTPPYFGHLGSTRTPFLPPSPFLQASPYDQADARSPYGRTVAPARTTYNGHRQAARAPGRAGHSAPHPRGFSANLEHGTSYNARPEYAYRYGVHDPTTKDVKSAWEQRDGDDTQGGYSVVEPDGHTRVVQYTVTKHGGFNAHVKHLPPEHYGH